MDKSNKIKIFSEVQIVWKQNFLSHKEKENG